LPLLIGEIDKKLPADLPSSDEKRETLARRQANAAVALLKMNHPEKVWPLLKRTPPDDPRVRSYLIHRLAALGADAGPIIKHLDEEPDITIRRALLLSLGEFNEKELPEASRTSLLRKLQTIYRTDPDPGLHAAAEWLLRTWKQCAWLKQVNEAWAKNKEQRARRLEGIEELVKKEKEKTPPQWYINGQGQTMVVIPGPVEFVMGSPVTEADRRDVEMQHKRRIARTFALAATPVTREQFLLFRSTPKPELRRYPEPTCPIGNVVWYEAASYCNWLSKAEGIREDQWCYEIAGQVIKLKKSYLSLSGYRLPTEAEMEYAIRAGAVTARYFGETEELLPKYEWYEKNSKDRTWPVGSKKPNDLGFFDVQGNVLTWCQECYKPYPQAKKASDDREDGLVIVSTESRLLRGGSFLHNPVYVRSAFRDSYGPSHRVGNIGIRPARTLPPGSLTALPLTADADRR
jgi:formylglycine-generating enzyme required for sulfatase activity